MPFTTISCFTSLPAAQLYVAGFGASNHADPQNAQLHLALAGKPRASDYPVLFHLAGLVAQPNAAVNRIFDLGGNTGNLFDCYDAFLKFPPEFSWTVYDLPENMRLGQQRSAERNEHRLRFTHDLDSLSDTDLLLISGSLHYFDWSLAALLETLPRKPKFIIINRTPLTDGPETVTVQDSWPLIVPCRLLNRAQLEESLTQTGYELVDSWPAHELNLKIPCFPELSVLAYAGLFFRKID